MERILVVDDEIYVCNILERFFTSKGYQVYSALDGETAVNKVKKFKPHIVLLDIMMPGMGGIDTLEEIKKIDPAIGVIMVTAIIDEELAKRALRLGAYEYIMKPLDINYLDTVVLVKMVDFWS